MSPEATNYRDLPLLPGLELPHAWEVFGRADEVGTLNLLTPERVLAALAVPAFGKVFNLSLPLNLPDPPMFGREAYRHSILTSRNGQDDYVDGFYLQGSSQWDGLRHVKAREFGFYGGVADEDAGSGGGKLGVEKWAKRGIIGRGVLLDVARHLNLKGSREDPFGSFAITADLLAEVAEEHGVGFRTGDI